MLSRNIWKLLLVVVASILIVGLAWFLLHPTDYLHVDAVSTEVESDTINGSMLYVELQPGGRALNWETFFNTDEFIYLGDAAETPTMDPDSVLKSQIENQEEQIMRDNIIDTSLPQAAPFLADVAATSGPIDYTIVGARIVSVDSRSSLVSFVSEGDIVSAVSIPSSDGETTSTYPVPTAEQLLDSVSLASPGQMIQIALESGDVYNAVLSETGALGLTLETYKIPDTLPQTDIPLQVATPSAGLATALILSDNLDTQDLLSGRIIAALGSMQKDGNVGPVSNLDKRLQALPNADMIFIYTPQATPEILDKYPTIITVETLEEARAKLLEN